MAGGTSYETDVHSALWTIDLATGELLDEEASDLSFINAIQFVDYEDGTMELLEGGMGGLVTIGGVALSL